MNTLIAGGANRPGDSIENGVARAVRLAANLSNQLFVDLPPEATAAAASASGASKEVSNNAATANDLQNGLSSQQQPRKSRGKQRKINPIHTGLGSWSK